MLERGARRTVRVMSGKSQNGEEECTELLQTLIRNACVNDGTVESGGEIRSAPDSNSKVTTRHLGDEALSLALRAPIRLHRHCY
jgi:hypothetical protein